MLDRMARVCEPLWRFLWWVVVGVDAGAGPGRHRAARVPGVSGQPGPSGPPGPPGVQGVLLAPYAPPPVVPLPHGAMVRRAAGPGPGTGRPAACVCAAAPSPGERPRRRVLWVVEDGFGLAAGPGSGPRPLRTRVVAR